MTYKEYKEIIENAKTKEELEKILNQIENDEEISARKYLFLRHYIIDRMF